MSVPEADVMAAMGEQVYLGPTQTAEYSAAIERQHAYEAAKAAEFGEVGGGIGGLPLSAVPLVAGLSLGGLLNVSFGGGQGVQLGSFGGGGGGSSVAPAPGEYQVFLPVEAPPFPAPEVPMEPMPPMDPRFPVPIPPEGPAAVPFLTGGLAIFGGILAALWEGWPNEIGPEWPPGHPLPGEAGQSPSAVEPPPDVELGPLPDEAFGPPGPQNAQDTPSVYPKFPNPTGYGPFITPEDVGSGPVPDSAAGPPGPANATSTEPVTAPGFSIPPWGWALIGAGISGAISRGGGGQSVSSPLTSLEDALLESAGAPAPGMLSASSPMPMTYIATSSGYDQDGCNCGPKKRGKKRKCLARAQLTWRSGPKKGKAAGSRCYRYAN